jgi:RNA polymerase sigma-70 factor, ECF subfamily
MLESHEPDADVRDHPPGPSLAAGIDTSELMPLIYDELRRLTHRYMGREPIGHTLQTTAIVHEAYLRLAQQERSAWCNRAQFYAVASQMVRRVLVDHARARLAQKRGGGAMPLGLTEMSSEEPVAPIDVLALDEALLELASLDARQCRVVELRYFGGLSIEETAEALGVSIGTVKGDWRIARAWLKERLEGETGR